MNRLISQSITEESMKERYAELAKNTPTQEEVRARHILVDTEADAKEVIKMIQGGQSFERWPKPDRKTLLQRKAAISDIFVKAIW